MVKEQCGSIFKRVSSNPVLIWAVLTAIMGVVVSFAVERNTASIELKATRLETQKNTANIDIWYTVAQDLKIREARTTERLDRLQSDVTDLRTEVRNLNEFLRRTP